MSGWARQPLPQLIALLRIMTHPQPIPAHGHLHLHLLIFHVVQWVFITDTHTLIFSLTVLQHAHIMHAHSPEQTDMYYTDVLIQAHT